MRNSQQFHIMARSPSTLLVDYGVFILLLLLSIFVPLWSKIFGKRKEISKSDYVFAVGKVTIWAMMLSIARGTLGVRSFLGFPSELFYQGASMWETVYGMMNAYPIVLYVFIPVYFSLGITSIYQYLDFRFNSRLVRCLASSTFIFRQVLNLGVTVYTPSVALNIIDIPYWMSIVGITLISIMFTILGGLKAAITADVIQTVTMIVVSIIIFIQGVLETGGLDKVYTTNRDEKRLEFFTFSGRLDTRVDTVSAWLGQLFISMSLLGCQQNFVQRYLSMKSFKEVKKTMLNNIPLIFLLFSLSWVMGMSIFSTYFQCDPLQAGYIKKSDEILPFFVEDKFFYLPGFLGLFLATIFNGALSLTVSNVNSLATVVWEDFLSPLPHFKGFTDKKQVNVIKLVGVIFSVLIMGVAFCVGLFTGVIESSMLMTSMTSGPLLGVFLLALLIPIANWKGAATGIICSHIITIWLAFGRFTVTLPVSTLPNSIEGCSNDTFSEGITKSSSSWLLQSRPLEVVWDGGSAKVASTVTPASDNSLLESWYSITYMYWSLIGTFATVFIGTIVSWLTSSDSDTFEAKLLHPCIVRFMRILPGEPRKYKPSSDGSAATICAAANTPANNIVPVITVVPASHDNLGYEEDTASPTKVPGLNESQQENEDDNKSTRQVIEFSKTDLSPETTGIYRKVMIES